MERLSDLAQEHMSLEDLAVVYTTALEEAQ
jgi:hypothetical protein